MALTARSGNTAKDGQGRESRAGQDQDDVGRRGRRAAYEISQLLVRFDSLRVMKVWFMGLNPQLDDESPAEAIREGRLKEAMNAARAFVAGG